MGTEIELMKLRTNTIHFLDQIDAVADSIYFKDEDISTKIVRQEILNKLLLGTKKAAELLLEKNLEENDA